MMRYSVLKLSFVTLSTLLINSCTGLEPYQTHSTETLTQTNPITCTHDSKTSHCLEALLPGDNSIVARERVQLGFVEYDEFGNLANRVQMYDVLQQVSVLKNPIIIVYTHGWRHLARNLDGNLVNFQKMLLSVRKAEEAAHPNDARPVVGIYVGWRGLSIDSENDVISATTMWDRKNTATDVGNGGVEELFVRLNRMRWDNEHIERSRLVLVGHSFGGLIIYTALHHHFVERLTLHSEDPSRTKPLGDIVVLVNPALEAMRYKSLFNIAWTDRKYNQGDPPFLLMVTSEADKATGVLFPMGRSISTIFNNYRTRIDKKLNITTVGHYRPYVTHQLVPAKSNDQCNGLEHEPKVMFSGTTEYKSLCYKNDLGNGIKLIDTEENIYNTILTRCDTAEDCIGVKMHPFLPKLPDPNGIPLHMPILNVQTTKEVMANHGDIWNPTMQLFLTGFIASSLEGIVPAIR